MSGIATKDIAWAAGFYEGEGSLSNHFVNVVQKDKWALEKLKLLFGGEIHEYGGGTAGNGKTYFYWRLFGTECRGFLLTIFTFLSPRRRKQLTKNPLFFRDDRTNQKKKFLLQMIQSGFSEEAARKLMGELDEKYETEGK